MTAQEVYDWLLAERVREPATLVLGTRHVIGRWEKIAALEPSDYVCPSGRVAILVLGEGDDWIEAHAAAKAYLARDPS